MEKFFYLYLAAGLQLFMISVTMLVVTFGKNSEITKYKESLKYAWVLFWATWSIAPMMTMYRLGWVFVISVIISMPIHFLGQMDAHNILNSSAYLTYVVVEAVLLMVAVFMIHRCRSRNHEAKKWKHVRYRAKFFIKQERSFARNNE